MTLVISILVSLYIGALVGHRFSFYTTNFIRPKGLWLLVPFRVSGWRNKLCPDKVYPLKWVWEYIS